ncbi:MAG: AbfB domain-containing protein [Firmicutes bacterium]|nr:AbfB domain-containing protein [Bacillota bacterium]
MRHFMIKGIFLAVLVLVLLSTQVLALVDNPILKNVRTADPSPLVYNGRFYIVCGQDEVNTSAFDMYAWRLMSSADMNTWTDHGVIARPTGWMPANRAWASSLVYRNSKFYFYIATDSAVGVMTATNITGPYTDPLGRALIDKNTPGHANADIDPCCFIDDDGQAYLFWGGSGTCRYARLNSDMISLATSVMDVPGLTAYLEAPFVFKANGTYFLMYADQPWPSEIRYATASSISGPWTYRGIIGTPTGNGTNHEGAAYFNGQWYYVYHTEELSGGNPYSRSVCVDKMTISGNTISPISYTSFWMGGSYNRLQSYNYQDRYVRHYNFDVRIDPNVDPVYDSRWRIVPGLANSNGYISFESVNYPGYYLRHYNYDFRLEKSDGSSIFKADATFKQVAGLGNSSWSSFQSYNFPTRYIRHYNYYLRLDPISTDIEKADATFRLTQ